MNNQEIDPREHFAIRTDDGRYLYHVPLRHRVEAFRADGAVTLLGDGEPLSRLHHNDAWWLTDQPVTAFTVRWRPQPKTTAYTLDNPGMESSVFPASVSAADWEDFSERHGDKAWDFYSSVTEQQPERTDEIAGGPWRIIGGEAPPAEHDSRWVTSLPHALTNHPEYGWWMPGRLTGLRDAVQAHANKLGHVDYASTPIDGNRASGMLNVRIKLPFQQPVTRQSDRAWDGRKLKKPRTVPVTAQFTLNLPVPVSVHGDTYAEALAAWNAQYAYWTDLIDHQAEAGVTACNTCMGHGYLPTDTAHTPVPGPRNEY
ncbi:hypothetical protein ACIF6L_34870 [Kitasatospora sp. NPDC086009]|uniref:hypothetical protein n=1 Tax=unclassified Kitasatospora TaxID=2633591 RepID=UPI0037C72B78